MAGAGASGADRAAEKAAMVLYRQARQAELAGDRTRAYLLYSQAAAKDPGNKQAWIRAQGLKPAEAGAQGENRKNELPLAFSGGDIFGEATAQDLAANRRILPPAELSGREGRRDFDLRGLDSKQAFELVAKAFGLEPVFDSAYQVRTNLRVRLSDADYRDALRSVEAASDSFAVPLNSRLFLVANETTQKRSELDAVTTVVIPAPEPFSIQDIQEIATAVRGTLDVQKLFVDSARRLIVIRDRSSKVRMAQKLVQDVMKPRAQVAVDVELLTTDDSSSLNYGMSLPTSFQVSWLGRASSLSTTYPGGFSAALGIGGGKSFIGLGLTNASLFGYASKSNARTLLNAEVVATDGTPATLHVGDRYPIQANSYLGTTTGTGTTFTPPPSITFEDLGLLLKVTPRVHDGGDVTLEVEAEFKLLGSKSVDNIPVISNRKFQSKVRVANGEWAILAGLMTDSEGHTVTGMPGLSLLPLLRTNSRTRGHGETLIVFKPRVLNLPAMESVMRPAWVGTESHPRPAM